MALVILLGVAALVLAAMTVPERRRRVDAARWHNALRTLRDRRPTPPPGDLPTPCQAPRHVRIIRRRGRPTGR